MASTEVFQKQNSLQSTNDKSYPIGPFTKEQQLFSELSRTHKDSHFIEDLILDKIANRNIVHSKSHITNPWLRNPFKFKLAFFIGTHDQLQMNFKTNYSDLRDWFVKFGFSDFIQKFERCLTDVLKTPDMYLNQFHRFIGTPGLPFPYGTVLFVFFLSKHFKRRYVSFALEFLLLVEFRFNQNFANDLARKKFFLEVFVKNEDFSMIRDTQKWYSAINEGKADPQMDPVFLFSLFAQYMHGNNFLIVKNLS